MTQYGRNSSCFQAALTIVLLLLAIVPAAGGESPPAAAKTARHENTNVIMISIDILRPDHLGAYGYRRDTSPNIDRLAKQSVLFENAIAHSYLTPVAHMSVITGQYPRSHGMLSFEVTKDDVSKRTLPEILKAYGYETAAVMSSPEFFMRYDTESGKIINPKDIFSHSFDYYGRTVPDASGSVRVNPTGAIDWLRKNRDKKFFLWIESGLLHPPFSQTVPEPLKSSYDPKGYTPFFRNHPINPGKPFVDKGVPTEVLFHIYRGDYYLDFKPVHKLTAEDRDFIVGRYDAGLKYTDQFLGDLLRTVDDLGLNGKTLVIFHSIHGEALGEHGYFFHHDVFDTEIKTALTFRFPENAQAGKRIKRQIQSIDILPTILDYLSIPVNHEAQGASLLPFIQGKDKEYKGSPYAFIDRIPWWEYVLEGWHLENQSDRGADYTPLELERIKEYRTFLRSSIGGGKYPPECIAIRTNEWKLILRERRELLEKVSWWNFITGTQFPIAEVELYDLKNDPMEQMNVAREHPEVVRELKAKLLAWNASNPKPVPRLKDRQIPLIIPYP